ncbi:hypothetical protein GGF46_000132 [Coemansia sp. RSA 552]|nr:hypothetical protein GGF46_000132 [Coemansia sp. RSA 552]
MRSFAAVILASSAVLAQEIGFSGGADVVDGPNAISNPNINNGWQADSSLFAGGNGAAAAGPDVFNNVFGSSFTNVNSNAAAKDNIVNNPSFTHVKGNDGWSANGDANALGPVQNEFKRDVVFADNHHQINEQTAQTVGVPSFHTLPLASAFVKRQGDVVFADKHHQVNSEVAQVTAPLRPLPIVPFSGAAAFAKRDVVVDNQRTIAQTPVVAQAFAPYQWPAFQPLYVPFSYFQPIAAAPQQVESDQQKATIVQNQA